LDKASNRNTLSHRVQFHDISILAKKSGRVERVVRKRWRLSSILTTWTRKKVSSRGGDESLSFKPEGMKDSLEGQVTYSW